MIIKIRPFISLIKEDLEKAKELFPEVMFEVIYGRYGVYLYVEGNNEKEQTNNDNQ